MQSWAGSAPFWLPGSGRRWCCYSSLHCSRWVQKPGLVPGPCFHGGPKSPGDFILLGDSADAGRVALRVDGPRCSRLVVLGGLHRHTGVLPNVGRAQEGNTGYVGSVCVCACVYMCRQDDFVCVCVLAGQLGMRRCMHAYR